MGLSRACNECRSPPGPDGCEWPKRLRSVVSTLAAMFEQVTVPLVVLLGAGGNLDSSNANQVCSPVTLELRLKNTGVRLCLLLKSREDKPRHDGEAGWKDREERGSARGKRGGHTCTETRVGDHVAPQTNLAQTFQNIPLYLYNKLFLIIA